MPAASVKTSRLEPSRAKKERFECGGLEGAAYRALSAKMELATPITKLCVRVMNN